MSCFCDVQVKTSAPHVLLLLFHISPVCAIDSTHDARNWVLERGISSPETANEVLPFSVPHAEVLTTKRDTLELERLGPKAASRVHGPWRTNDGLHCKIKTLLKQGPISVPTDFSVHVIELALVGYGLDLAHSVCHSFLLERCKCVFLLALGQPWLPRFTFLSAQPQRRNYDSDFCMQSIRPCPPRL